MEDNRLLVKHAGIIDDLEDLYEAHQVWSDGCHVQHEADVYLALHCSLPYLL